jgi:hypothetical protein
MEWHYAWKSTVLPDLRHGRNPWKTMREHLRNRGMSYWIDVRDWLGGYPMEFAGIAETKAFARDELGMELLNISAGEANTEYLFRRAGSSNYWDQVRAERRLEALTKPFAPVGGHAFTADLPDYVQQADDMDDPRRSRLMLYEDGIPIGFAHQTHADVKAHGGGRYSHWRKQLMFSATDNTDPNSNGRQYQVCLNGLP